MAINLAKKYSPKVVERYTTKSLTELPGMCKDYDWQGVKTVTVYSLVPEAIGDYTRSGSNRYGEVKDVQDTIQELTTTKDRSISLVIDKGDSTEQMAIKTTGKVTAMQNEEVFFPEFDKYKLSVWGATTNTTGSAAALTKENIYEKFLAATEKLDEKLVPQAGRVAFMSPATYNLLKLCPEFVKQCESGQKMINSGHVGEVDGVQIIKVPSTYMPSKVGFIVMHPSCTIAPLKMQDVNLHMNPPGISGHQVDMRWIYDCFVLEAKKDAIVKHVIA